MAALWPRLAHRTSGFGTLCARTAPPVCLRHSRDARSGTRRDCTGSVIRNGSATAPRASPEAPRSAVGWTWAQADVVLVPHSVRSSPAGTDADRRLSSAPLGRRPTPDRRFGVCSGPARCGFCALPAERSALARLSERSRAGSPGRQRRGSAGWAVDWVRWLSGYGWSWCSGT
jgi:hypothetical protein